jgi:hypothetical protein
MIATVGAEQGSTTDSRTATQSKCKGCGCPVIPKLVYRVTGWVGVRMHALVELGVRVWHTHVRSRPKRGRSGSAAWTRLHCCP